MKNSGKTSHYIELKQYMTNVNSMKYVALIIPFDPMQVAINCFGERQQKMKKIGIIHSTCKILAS